jgi:16S rRNA (cytosine967-C5)-methyltransferase
MKISPARLAAFEILLRIEIDRAFSSVLLPAFEERLSPADRGLCHELVLGVLRRQLYLDKIIESLAGAKKLDPEVRIALRLGAYQLLYLDKVPAYSALNESVSLVQKAKKTSAKGFVNAILRRVSEKAPALSFADEIERISVETSHPRWLVEKWTGEFGADDAEAIASANNIIPQTAFRVTSDVPLGGVEKSEFVDGCFIASSMTRELLEKAERDEVYFQDEASQMVGQAVATELGNTFLDVCAAPGGKTTQTAQSNKSAMIVAGDVYKARVEHLRESCRRQGVGSVNVVQYDATTDLPFADESFDTVFVDAPCTGTGTIRRNPEIRYFLKTEDFDELPRKQLAILKTASKLVTPGGRLVYSTCSLEIEENELVVDKFSSGATTFEKAVPAVPERFITIDGFGRTFPHRDSMDGFFIAEFRQRRV